MSQESSAKPAEQTSDASTSSRRNFIKTSSSLLIAGGAMAGSLPLARAAHVFGSDVIKLGLVGCGGRGTGAATQAMNTEGPTKLIAMGDAFGDRLQSCLRGVTSRHADKVDVPQERQFVGFDAYKKVLEQDIDLVILATPPGFRPLHFEAAVNAGKHVFMEKPVATDAPGIRRVLAANEIAKQKNLAVAVGLQRHHEPRYVETIKRLHDGAIGDIIFARAYWNNDGVWMNTRDAKQTELEYQMRNWYYFNWLCGDHIVEQHIHNLDVINWLMQGYPTMAEGMGGREVRVGKDSGQIFDHHMIEFTYGDHGSGTKMMSCCRHQPKTWSSVSEHAHGTKGYCDISGAKIFKPNGEVAWAYGNGGGNGHQEEHHDLFAALRRGEIPNEGEYGAMSTMTAIFGRMATYSGKNLSWDEAFNSQEALADFDKLTAMADEAPVQQNPEGKPTRVDGSPYPTPIPGKTVKV
ncbi:Gfo/Idh/MocA family oxidoreductase [Blastopirellula sp. JC732]|uniref:Gfo/Idh/MocA family oxidoreductase n=1 Tax=Blastopirellula sediminis TaxID=2894196 RepID=A0A9X1MLL0_9BACT|nr:Gfo/Idh/MocA family oxidoreductase [Blastopirellula sediminis]MCC9608718.1 Gfo/Idh/MocA family oxidoreductase [Blastopirellula sediminis]MCC9628505.1 Gfo/Idh/MocA family oxidoreductase [Blastopirellula sediminis]